MLEIPYVGDESAFYIILPNEIDGITALENKLKDPSVLDEELNNLYNVQVEAQIPKFKIETTTDLKEILPKASSVFIIIGFKCLRLYDDYYFV